MQVIAGNDRGKTGKVTKALPVENKVVVEGVNIKAKHIKGEDGGIKRFEHPIHVSNVKLATVAKKSATKKSKTDDIKIDDKKKQEQDKVAVKAEDK